MSHENDQLLEHVSAQESETDEIKAMLWDLTERIAIPRLTAEEQTEVLRARAASDRRATEVEPLAVEDDVGGETNVPAASGDPRTPGTVLVPEAQRGSESGGETPAQDEDSETRNPRY